MMEQQYRKPLIRSSSGNSFEKKRVAILYDDIVRPDTTGVYCRKALERLCRVEHFQPAELDDVPEGFDLYLFIDDGFRYLVPERLRPAAWWVIDTHLNYFWDVHTARQFDVIFSAQRDGAGMLERDGVAHVHWLPLACDPEVHKGVEVEKEHDVVFVGNFAEGARNDLLRVIDERYTNNFIGQKFFEEMAETFSRAKIVFNQSIRNDVNMRVFEAVSAGSMLMTNNLDENGLDLLFEDCVHLATFRDEQEMIEKIDFYLRNEEKRAEIAATGRKHAHENHTYLNRMEAVLDTMFKTDSVSVPDHDELIEGLTSIVILTHNQLEYTRLCIKSIEKFTDSPYEIIFVDNASTDGTPEYLENITRSNREYRLISNEENRGYAAGNNQGIFAARGEYTLIMNNDVIVTENWLERLKYPMVADSKVSLVGPKTNFVKGSQIDLDVEYDSIESMVEYAAEVSEKHEGEFVEVDFLVGFCFLGRTSALRSVGCFDEVYGIGNYEDNDLCWTLRAAGNKLRLAEDCFVHHFGHVSFDASDVDYDGLIARNREIFEKKWGVEDEEEIPQVKGENWLGESTAAMYNKLGNLYLEGGRWSEATEAFRSSLDLQEGSDIYVKYGIALWESGKKDKAFEAFSRALAIDYNNGDAVVNIVDAGYALGRLEQVESSLVNALSEGAGDDLHTILADCRYRQNDVEGAVSALQDKLAFTPGDPELMEMMSALKEEASAAV